MLLGKRHHLCPARESSSQRSKADYRSGSGHQTRQVQMTSWHSHPTHAGQGPDHHERTPQSRWSAIDLLGHHHYMASTVRAHRIHSVQLDRIQMAKQGLHGGEQQRLSRIELSRQLLRLPSLRMRKLIKMPPHRQDSYQRLRVRRPMSFRRSSCASRS